MLWSGRTEYDEEQEGTWELAKPLIYRAICQLPHDFSLPFLLHFVLILAHRAPS